MESCLAETGIDLWMVVAIGVALVIIAAGIISRPSIRKGFGGLLVLSMLVFSVISTPAHAASECSITTVDDTSTGAQGEVQTYSVLDNDEPSTGASFDLSSLTLSLVSSPVSGSTVSSDGKTVTVPGEGVYVAGSDGKITFTPEASFSGTTVGVVYTITDTAGYKSSSTYKPVVTATTATAPVATDDAMGMYCVLGLSHYSLTNFSTTTIIPLDIYGDFNYCMGTAYYDDIEVDAVWNPGVPLIMSNAVPSDTSDGTIQRVWTTQLLANDTSSVAADPASVDLDPATAGVQQSFSGAGFTAVYTPGSDTLTVTVTDVATYAPYAGPTSSTYESNSSSSWGGGRKLLNGNVLTYQYANTAGTLSNIATVKHPGYKNESVIITVPDPGPGPVFP